ncbi:MAG: hypothetical protein LC105_12540 [Chitinophagales bacterium]|nr:hypothetical protein [Chitinophagales bacterium]MCZ2394681.1 hypothetical protein [Chitinophagales bacterium]
MEIKSFRYHFTIYSIIAIVILIHFSSVLKNDFSLDDYLYINQVNDIFSWSDLHLAFHIPFGLSDFRPVTSITFAIESILFDGNIDPNVSHGINLMIYFLCCVLFFNFLQKLPFPKHKTPIVWIATLLFATLPLHNSMVSNIKSRDGLLSFMFGMLFLNLIVRFAFLKKSLLLKLIFLVLSFLFLGLGFYSKLDAFNFLGIALFLFIIFSPKWNIKFIVRLILIIIISSQVAFHSFKYWSNQKEGALKSYSEVIQKDPVLFSENPIINYPEISYKIAFAIQTVFEYITMVFSMSGHYYYYGYDMIPVLPLNDFLVLLKGFLIFSIIFSAFVFYKKSKLYSFGIAFFFTSLLYCSNLLIPISGIIADRYIFIASAGACIVLAVILYESMVYLLDFFSQKNESISQIYNSNNQTYRAYLFLIPALLVSTLFYLPKNIDRCGDWKSLTSIFEADLPEISKYSYDANLIAMKNYMALAKISTSPQKEIYYNKVIEYGRNAHQIYPDGQYALDLVITAYDQMDKTYDALNLAKEAIARFDTTEIGWRVLNEYYYYKSEYDSVLMSSQKVLGFSPLDPFVNMMYYEALNKTKGMESAMVYIDDLKLKYPKSKLPEEIKEILKRENK